MAWKTTSNMQLKYADPSTQGGEIFDVDLLLNYNWRAIDAVNPSARLDTIESTLTADEKDIKTIRTTYTTMNNSVTTANNNANTAKTTATTAETKSTKNKNALSAMLTLNFAMRCNGSYEGTGGNTFLQTLYFSAPTDVIYKPEMVTVQCDGGYPLVIVRPVDGTQSTVKTGSGEIITASWSGNAVTIKRDGGSTAYNTYGTVYRWEMVGEMTYCGAVSKYLD